MMVFLPVLALLIATMLLSLAIGLFNTVVSLRVAEEGYLSSMVGIVMSCYFTGQWLGCLIMPRLITSVGQIRVYAALASLLSVCAVTFGMVFDLTLWAVLRIVCGACAVGLFMVSESWLNGASSNQQRGMMLGLYMTILYCSQAGGQLLLNLAPADDFKIYSIMCVLFSLALIPVVLSRRSKPLSGCPGRFSIIRLICVCPTGAMGCVTSGLISGAFYGLGPVYGAQSGLSTSDISFFMGLWVIGALLVQVVIGRVSDRLGRRGVSIVLLLGTSLISGLFLTDLVEERLTLFILVTIYGGLSLSIYTLSNAHANDHVSQQDRVPVAANLLLLYSFGAVLGPLISSQVMDAMGHDGLFGFSVVVSLVMAIFIIMSARFEGLYEPHSESSVAMKE
ncbi:MFS transporter [Amphritea sp. 1_MG-2023]|uniref:MFS transporter n=1 Tax=Amphritea sp. 1_MG-2023 TaxID=3062670 RepID=UPI0026E22986|nr:MFS transporter [Amphritea sp. 1_MG-2023]MDO6565277.1 MFS transporter [Amphritea sp. 1_MG-2023]